MLKGYMDESTDKPEAQHHNLQPRKKVIQPSAAILKDVAENPDAYARAPSNSAPSLTPVPEANVLSTEPQASTETFEPRNVYPGPKDSHTPPSRPEAKNDQSDVFNFSSGYTVGSGVYWFQLLAVVILGLLLSIVVLPLLKYASGLTTVWVLLLYYTGSLAVIAYVVPYRRLLRDAIDKPLWLTLFGATIQSFLISLGYSLVLLLFALLFRADLSDGVLSLFGTVGGGLYAVAVVVIVAAFVLAYFGTRISWGLAFKFYAKLNIQVVRIIGLTPPLFLVASFIYSLLVR
jgi:hypothetical protein